MIIFSVYDAITVYYVRKVPLYAFEFLFSNVICFTNCLILVQHPQCPRNDFGDDPTLLEEVPVSPKSIACIQRYYEVNLEHAP